MILSLMGSPSQQHGGRYRVDPYLFPLVVDISIFDHGRPYFILNMPFLEVCENTFLEIIPFVVRMTESIKNVEITEQKPATPPNTPEKSPANTIKERLNLHVKRRLQQEIPNQEQSLQQQQQFNSTTSNSFANNKNLESMLNKHSDKQVKARKCCQKRKTEKTSPDGTAVRKCKRNKTKQSVSSPVGNTVDDMNCTMISAVTDILPSCSAPVGSGNADGDGDGHDGETKCITLREKDRCVDVLGMVLSAKKNALMQHPNVQAFLQQVTEAIKS